MTICHLGLFPSMRTAEHFTGTDPFRVNYTNADPDIIFPTQGKNGPIAASYNSKRIQIYVIDWLIRRFLEIGTVMLLYRSGNPWPILTL